MTAERRENAHKLARGLLTALAGLAATVLPAVGYTGDAPTTAGLNAGTMSGLITATLAGLAIWYPRFRQFSTFWKSLSNQGRVEQLEAKVEQLTEQLKAAGKTPLNGDYDTGLLPPDLMDRIGELIEGPLASKLEDLIEKRLPKPAVKKAKKA